MDHGVILWYISLLRFTGWFAWMLQHGVPGSYERTHRPWWWPTTKMTGSEKFTLNIESGFRINMAGRSRIGTHSWLASKRNTTIDDMTWDAGLALYRTSGNACWNNASCNNARRLWHDMKDHFARFAGRGSYICMYIYIYSYTRYIYGNGLIYSLRFFLGLHDTMVIVLFIRSRIGHLPCAALCETLFTCLWIDRKSVV